MKQGIIRDQHLYLKLAIFGIGISTGFEASLRQLGAQGLFIMLYMIPEYRLFGRLLFSLRKLLGFLAAYWLLATLFAVPFPQAVVFSARIIYLVMITVSVWAAVDKDRILRQCAWCHKFKAGRAISFFTLSTWLFIREYFREYQKLQKQESIAGILDRAILAGKNVHEKTAFIENKVQELMDRELVKPSPRIVADLYGFMFLSLLVIISSL